MRKLYKTPLSEPIVLVVADIVATSGSDTGDTPGAGIGTGKVDTSESWAGESRGDWSDIWSEM